jgi:hypothetical protein
MRIAILTFDGFNELDSFIALGLLNRLSALGWKAELACPTAQVTSMNGVTVTAQQPLEFANEADVVLFGSGIYTRAIAENSALLDRLQLDPTRSARAPCCWPDSVCSATARPAPTPPPNPGWWKPVCAWSMRLFTRVAPLPPRAAACRPSTWPPG